jgi:hypothetical protein
MLQFLKKNLQTILLTFALMLVSSLLYLMYVLTRVSDLFQLGFPFRFFLSWGPCPPGQSCVELNPFFLILDFIIWYAVSAVVFRRAKQ